jgi:hypothetical protein
MPRSPPSRRRWRSPGRSPSKVARFDKAEANTWLEIVVTEGRPHLVKRLCAAIGHPVVGDGTYGGIRDALDNAFKDLTMHQLGLLAGVQESLSAVLKRLDPKVVEQEGKDMGKGGFLASSEKRAWKRYSEVFHEIFAENSKMFNELIYPNVRKGYLALHDNDAKASSAKKDETTKKGGAAQPPSMTQKNPGSPKGG